jgi:hypothetical protein
MAGIKDVNDEIKDLNRELGKTPTTPFKASDMQKALDVVKELRAEFKAMNSDLSYVARSFRDSVAELSKQNTELNNVKSSLRGISNIASKLSAYKQGDLDLGKKEIQNLEKQAKLKFLSLQYSIQSGRLKPKELSEAKASLQLQQNFIDGLKEIKNLENQISNNKGTSFFSGLEQISKSIPGLSKFSSAFENAAKASKEQARYNLQNFGSVEGMSKANLKALQTGKGLTAEKIKELGLEKQLIDAQGKGLSGTAAAMKAKSLGITATAESSKSPFQAGMAGLKSGISSTTSEALSFAGIITALVKSFFELDTLIGNTAKQLGISYNAAAGLSQELNTMANSSNNIFVTTKGMHESFNQINAALGTNGRISEEILVTQTELVKQAGYSVEAATMISKLSLATSKPAKEITTAFLGQAKALNLANGTAINEKQLIEDIAKTSKSILISFASQPNKLMAAAYEVKKLGLALNDVKGIQDNLLNVESSIAAEFEAEVLTGKQLNLERARYYALTNNISGLAKELGAQGITQAKFGGMNVIQQEAVAKAMGMTRDQMSEMLMNQEAMSKLSSVDGKTAKEKYNNAVKMYGVEKANAMLGDETLAQQMQSASTQEKFAASIEKLKDLFNTLVEPLMPVLNVFADIFKIIGLIMVPIGWLSETFGGWGEKISSMIGPLGAIGKLLKGIAMIAVGYAAYSAYASLATIPVVGVALGAVAAAGITAAGMGFLGSIKDGVIDPKKGPIVSGEFGSVQLNPNDQIAAGTNLISNNRPSSEVNYEKIAAAAGNAAAKAIAAQPVHTYFDMNEHGRRYQQSTAGQTTRKL